MVEQESHHQGAPAVSVPQEPVEPFEVLTMGRVGVDLYPLQDGPDAFGRFVHQALRRMNVDDRYITDVADLLTPVTFCEMFPPDHFPLLFYRLPIAPDLMIRPEELDLGAVADADIFWTTVTGLSQEPSRSSHHAAW